MIRTAVLVLGPVRVAAASGVREVPGRRQRSLLAALAVHGGRPVSVGELVDAIWDDDPPEQARNTVQSYVSRLRKAYGPIIEHGPAGYRLATDVTTDVGEVRAIRSRLDRAPPTDDRERARLALDALDRWTGPALGDLRDDRWFAGVAGELDELESSLLDRAVEAMIAVGDAAAAVTIIEGRAADRLVREPTQTLLVQALHAAGRTTEALRAADRYRTWLRDETGLLPGPMFVRAERAALDGEPVPSAAPSAARSAEVPTAAVAPVGLPRPTPLLGRERDLAELEAALARGRLVTVTGTGGIGKTRLVAELTSGPGEWIVVALAPVEPGGVATAIAARLGYRDDVTDPRVLVDLLRPSACVLVLDNAEHVIVEVRRLARLLVDGCPDLAVLVTSRIRLDLPDEQLVVLDPLAVDGADAPAVGLFLDRLHRARPGVTLDPEHVAEVCARLDGVPLALELAASRAAVLGLEALIERLDSPIDVLSSAVDDEARHATLGSVIEWSVALLDEPARRVLAALGVFHGTFDVAAAEVVAAAVTDDPVAPIVGRLADASLVAPAERLGEHRLLEVIRHFADRELQRLEVADRVRAAHARWVAEQLHAVDVTSVGPDETATSARLDALRPEIDAATSWALGRRRTDLVTAIAVSLAGPLMYRPDHELVRSVHEVATDPATSPGPALLAAGARSAFLVGELGEVEALAHRALDHADCDPASQHRAYHALGVVRLYQGRFEESRRWFERVVDVAADPSLVERLDALGGLGLALCYAGDAEAAAVTIAQHRALADVADSDTYRAFGTYMTAEHRLLVGDVEGATAALSDASELAWSVGARFVWGIASTVLASILVRHGPPEEARRHLPTLIERWRRSATWPQLWTTLRLVAESIRASGHADVALLVLTAADCDPAAPTLVGDDLARIEELRAALHDELGPAATGIAAAAAVIDRSAVLDRAIAALGAGVSAASA